MYRSSSKRAETAPTRIVYRSYTWAPKSVAIAVLLAVLATIPFGLVHASRLTCSRDAGACRVESLGLLVAERSRELALDDSLAIEVKTFRGKGGLLANATLVGRSGERIDLSGRHPVNRFDAGVALDAKARLASFVADATQRELDVWLRPSILDLLFVPFIGLVVLAAAASIAREHLLQLRAIEITVDHDRRTVSLGGREVAADDVTEVEVEEGRALTWSSGRSKAPIAGFRIAVATRSGERIVATPDFRGGERARHDAARSELRVALGMGAGPESPGAAARRG